MGSIILARHGEPALSRKVRLTSAQYRDWWAKYEIGGLKPAQTPPPNLLEAARRAGVILASTRPRAVETARAVAAERSFAQEEALIEAPLPPPAFPDWIRLSPRSWGFVARVWWWFFDHHQGEETRAQAEARAEAMADILIAHAAGGEDVLVLAHGFFNTMIGRVLIRRGWRCAEDGGFRYWSIRRFERRGTRKSTKGAH